MRPTPIGSKRRKSRAQCRTAKPFVVKETSDEEMKSRVAIRFFVKKSKRFEAMRKSFKRASRKNNQEEKSSLDCLMYLGLAPKGMETQQRNVSEQVAQTNFEFPKPKIYECYYCSKFFFHEFLLQKHKVFRHLNGNKRLVSKIWKKKQRLIHRKAKSTLLGQLSQTTESSSSAAQSRIPAGLPCDNDWITTEDIEKLFFDP